MNRKHNQPNSDHLAQISEPAILLRINQKYREGLSQDELYQITRGEWVIGKRRVHARYAFAVYQGIVVEVYRIKRWLPFTGKTPSTCQRWCFDGSIAEHLEHYKGCNLKHYFKHGASNPVMYVNCD